MNRKDIIEILKNCQDIREFGINHYQLNIPQLYTLLEKGIIGKVVKMNEELNGYITKSDYLHSNGLTCKYPLENSMLTLEFFLIDEWNTPNPKKTFYETIECPIYVDQLEHSIFFNF